jgi:hypothetical protein
MVLLHGGAEPAPRRSPTNGPKSRKVPQIGFKPDWTKHGRQPRSSATTPFSKRCRRRRPLPGHGHQDNLADKAKKLGIPVWKFGGA